MNNYLKFESPEGTCYIKESSVQILAGVDVAVFDCDGVLLDIRESYFRTVAETASTILEALTGSKINPDVFDREINFEFKQTGGFNNDWSLTYAYIIATLSILPNGTLLYLNDIAVRVQDATPSERLQTFSELRTPVEVENKKIRETLLRLAESIGPGGVDSIDKILLPKVGVNIKQLLRYPGKVGVSVISTLFEELFAGPSLFEETFCFPAQFTQRNGGYVDFESVIPKKLTFQRLENLLGGLRFGIASGSLMNSARHVLGETLQVFPREAQVWHDDVERAMVETGAQRLHKPSGYSLKQASSPYEPFKQAIYVGDTMGDILSAKNASTEDPRYAFMGVYSTVDSPDKTLHMFIREGADAVAPSVNQLPDVIEWARSEPL